MINPLPLVLLAKRFPGESQSKQVTSALMATLVKPPMLGLVTGIALAANNSQSQVAKPIVTTTSLPPPATNIALAATSSAANVSSDGKTKATITVSASDAKGNAVSGLPITFSANSGGVIMPANASTDANGLCVAVLSCGNPAAVNISVTASSGSVSATPLLIGVVAGAGGVAGSVAAKLVATADVNSLPNDGSAQARITVQVLDGAGNAVAGAPVNFSANANGVIKPASSAADINGLCLAVLGIGTDASIRTIDVMAACGAVSSTPLPIGVVAAGGGGGGPAGSGTSPSGGSSTTGGSVDPNLLNVLKGIAGEIDTINQRLGDIEKKVNAQLGQSLLAQVAPAPGERQREVPSFVWKTKEQARTMARQRGFPEPTFIARGDSAANVVIAQRPQPGSAWTNEHEDIALELG